MTTMDQQTSRDLSFPHTRSGGHRALAIAVRVFCVLPFALGAADMVGGARILTSAGAVLPEDVARDAVLNNQIRFWGAIWFGYGVLLWWASNDLRGRATVFRILMATLFLSGLGRAASVLQFGWASTPFTIAMAIELLSPPAFIALAHWLQKETAR